MGVRTMPDVRLIDANTLKSKMTVDVLGGHKRIWVCGVIDDAPTLDAQPVKHGKWSEYSRNGLETYIECTNCCVASRPIHLQMVTRNGSGLPDYCPNCGSFNGGK